MNKINIKYMFSITELRLINAPKFYSLFLQFLSVHKWGSRWIIIHHSAHIKESGLQQITARCKQLVLWRSYFLFTRSFIWLKVSWWSCNSRASYLLQLEDVAEFRTRTQAVQEVPVDVKSEVIQFDTVSLSSVGKTRKHTGIKQSLRISSSYNSPKKNLKSFSIMSPLRLEEQHLDCPL